MANSVISQLTLTIVDLRNLAQAELGHSVNRNELCASIATSLLGKRRPATDPSWSAAMFVAFVAGLRLNPEKQEVLSVGGHFFQETGIEVLSAEQLELLGEWLPDIQIADLRARVADCLWLAKRPKNHHHARTAIDAYVEASTAMLTPAHSEAGSESRPWPDAVDRFARALALARTLGQRATVVSAIESSISIAPSKGPCRARLIHLLLREDVDAEKYAALAQALAEEHERNAAQEGNGTLGFHFSREFWELARLWRVRLHGHDSIEAKNAATNYAMSFVAEAKRDEAAGSLAASAMHISHAVERLRDIGSSPSVIEPLLARATDLMRRAPRASIASPLDASEKDAAEAAAAASIEEGLAAVRGLPLIDALRRIQWLVKPMPKKSSRELLEELNEKFIAGRLMATLMIANDGRQLGWLPPQDDAPDEGEQTDGQERAMRRQLWDHARYYRQSSVSRVQGAIQQINLDHSPRLEDVATLVRDSHLVPDGHRLLFASGILYGLNGDFAAAVHILVPQLEGCLRHFAQRYLGRTLISQRAGGVQHVGLMQRALSLPELAECIGEDLAFELQGFFTSSLSTNFRNLLAHGMVGDGIGDSGEALYCWALCLMLCTRLTPRSAAAAPDEAIDSTAVGVTSESTAPSDLEPSRGSATPVPEGGDVDA